MIALFIAQKPELLKLWHKRDCTNLTSAEINKTEQSSKINIRQQRDHIVSKEINFLERIDATTVSYYGNS